MTRYRPCRYCGKPVKLVSNTDATGTYGYSCFEDLFESFVYHDCPAKAKRSINSDPGHMPDIEDYFLRQEEDNAVC